MKALFALCSTQCWVEEETGFLSLGIFRYSYNTLSVFRQFQSSNIPIGLILKKKRVGSVKNMHFCSHFSFIDPFNKD